MQSGWGATVKLEIDGIPIFVKKVPLNEIEGNSNNIGSTKNLFELPLYYQYGVGSRGFSRVIGLCLLGGGAIPVANYLCPSFWNRIDDFKRSFYGRTFQQWAGRSNFA